MYNPIPSIKFDEYLVLVCSVKNWVIKSSFCLSMAISYSSLSWDRSIRSCSESVNLILGKIKRQLRFTKRSWSSQP